MKTTDPTLFLVATFSLFVFIVDAESLDQFHHGNDTSSFLIYVPEDKQDQADVSISSNIPEPKNTDKRSVTSVEIVRSVEVDLDGKHPESSSVESSGSTDLLFSDSDGIRTTNQNLRQSTRNRSFRYRRLKTSASSQHSSSIPSQGAEENIPDEGILTDDLDFNSRILLGNILIRKTKEGETDEVKYSSYSEPKVSSNKYHTTYVNHNSTATANKTRVNIKFPPKLFPIKSPTLPRSNKTTISYSHAPSKNQTQKILYRSRLGKLSFPSRLKNKPNFTEPINQSQNKIEKGQSVTHWDFGKKTTHEPADEEENKATGIPNINISPVVIDISTHLPDYHSVRSTTQSSMATTPETVTEKVINKSVGHQTLVQPSVPNQQPTPVFNQIHRSQGTTVLPFLNTIRNIPVYNQFAIVQGTTVEPPLSTIKNFPVHNHVNVAQGSTSVSSVNAIKTIPAYNQINTLHGTTLVSPVNTIKSPQVYQVYYSHNGNVIRQDEGVIQKQEGNNIVQTSAGKNQLKQELRGNIVQQAIGQIKPVYGTSVLNQNFGPQIFPNQNYRNDIRNVNVQDSKTRPPQQINVGRVQPHQQDLRNWQPVYFIPHVPLPQRPTAPVIALQTVNTRSGPQTIPVFLQPQQPPPSPPSQQQQQQQQNFQSVGLVHQGYFPANILARSAFPGQDELFHEGVLVAYPDDIQGQPSDILPFIVE